MPRCCTRSPTRSPTAARCLHEPVSIACHGLLRAAPDDGEPVLVVGAGIIGLATLAALKGLFPRVPGHRAGPPPAPGRRRRPRAAPTTSCATAAGSAHFEELADLSGARVVGRKANVMLMGGFPYVVEAVGAPQSVTEALRAVGHRGTVLLLGAAGVSEVDLTPIWYKEAALVGSIDHTVDARLRARARRWARAVTPSTAPSTSSPPASFPTRWSSPTSSPLEDYRTAVETAIDRGNSHAIKVVFRP